MANGLKIEPRSDTKMKYMIDMEERREEEEDDDWGNRMSNWLLTHIYFIQYVLGYGTLPMFVSLNIAGPKLG